uniref:Uncharacterized protein n=1 Tax=Glossina palpalis gambiensis TaxID=67801 RepID=A0A1B0B6C2_9MUSC
MGCCNSKDPKEEAKKSWSPKKLNKFNEKKLIEYCLQRASSTSNRGYDTGTFLEYNYPPNFGHDGGHSSSHYVDGGHSSIFSSSNNHCGTGSSGDGGGGGGSGGGGDGGGCGSDSGGGGCDSGGGTCD